MDAAGAGMSEEEQLALALALSATQQQQDPTSNSASPSVYNPVDQSPSVEVFDELDADEEDLQIQAVPLAARSDLDNNTRLALASSDSEHVIDVDNLDLEQAISLTASQEEVQSSTALRLAKSGYSLVNRLVLGHDEALFREHKARLARRIARLGMVEYIVPDDGNCQFSSIADKVLGDVKFHHRVREAVVHQMNRHRSAYQPFVPVDYDRFLAAMSDTSVWGNHITIQAAADALGVRILLVTSNKTGPPILEILPSGHEYSRTIWLCYYCELHYNALYTKEEYEAKMAAQGRRGCRVQ